MNSPERINAFCSAVAGAVNLLTVLAAQLIEDNDEARKIFRQMRRDIDEHVNALNMLRFTRGK